MQAANSVPSPSATAFQPYWKGLQEKARIGLQATVQIVNDQIEAARLQDRVQASMQATMRAMSERVDEANHSINERVDAVRTGKKLLDDGGDAAVQAILAKKASVDTGSIDSDVLQRVRSAFAMFEDSALKLRTAQSGQQVEGLVGQTDFVRFAEEHEKRAEIYREVARMLGNPVIPLEMSAPEWDAYAIVQMRVGCERVVDRTVVQLNTLKQTAVSNVVPAVEEMQSSCASSVRRQQMACV